MNALAPVQQKFVLHWGEMGARWGINRTVAQIHALLFISPKPLNGPALVKVQETETLDNAAAVSKPIPLFSESEMGDFRSQWSKVQTRFVDEPRRTVEDADKLERERRNKAQQERIDGILKERDMYKKMIEEALSA